MTRKKQGKVRVGESRLGRSVFADTAFKAERRIGRIIGRVVGEEDYDSCYCMEFGNDRVLEPESPYRFLNHSCDANSELILWEDEDDPDANELWLYALRDIEVDEELTIDYGWDEAVSIPCRCGSANCRGTVSAATFEAST